MTNWLTAEDGTRINSDLVETFSVGQDPHTNRFNIEARLTSRAYVVVREFDTEDEAKASLADLIDRLVGVSDVAEIRQARGFAFPGVDSARVTPEDIARAIKRMEVFPEGDA